MTKLVKALCEDGAVVVGIPDSGEQNKDGNALLDSGLAVVLSVADIIPISETDTGNIQSQAEAEKSVEA